MISARAETSGCSYWTATQQYLHYHYYIWVFVREKVDLFIGFIVKGGGIEHSIGHLGAYWPSADLDGMWGVGFSLHWSAVWPTSLPSCDVPIKPMASLCQPLSLLPRTVVWKKKYSGGGHEFENGALAFGGQAWRSSMTVSDWISFRGRGELGRLTAWGGEACRWP